jgi:hypothetical protein
MKRRAFIAVAGVAPALAASALVRAQTARPFRIGVLSTINPRSSQFWVAFEDRLRELGHADGGTVIIDFVGLEGRVDRLGDAMNERRRRDQLLHRARDGNPDGGSIQVALLVHRAHALLGNRQSRP